MAPNLLVKTLLVRDDSTPILVNGEYEGKHRVIRTEFILQNVISHLLKADFSFPGMPPINSKEATVWSDVKRIVDDFKVNYSSSISKLCYELDITRDTVSKCLLGVSNELFCGGITWSRIVALFVFIGELAIQCLVKNFDDDIVEIIFASFSSLVKGNLNTWIEDHGGWEGIRDLSKCQQEPAQISPLQRSENSTEGWARSLFRSTIRVVGTLAHLANSAGQTFSTSC